jgi:hypothetical protein
VAHAHDLRDGGHRQAIVVGGSDGCVPLLSKRIGGLLQRGFALGVVLGKGGEAASDFGSLAFGAGDLRIV